MSQSERDLLVVKYGSSSVTETVLEPYEEEPGWEVEREIGVSAVKLTSYAEQLVDLHTEYDIIVTSSGSVADGRAQYEATYGKIKDLAPDARPTNQTLATIGSARLVTAWQEAFRPKGILAAQLLVTHNEIQDRSEHKTMAVALGQNRRQGIITVVNENDALAVRELNKWLYGGDNDGLGGEIALANKAAAYLIQTGVKGLLDEQGNIISKVIFSPEAHRQATALAGGPEGPGTGGMATKTEAAIRLAKAGIPTVIAQAGSDLRDQLAGRIGTMFVPSAA